MTTTNNERAAKIADAMRRGGLPAKDVTVLGQYVHITYRGESSARKAGLLLSHGGFRIDKVWRSIDQTIESRGRKPEYVDVWRVCVVPK